MPLIKVKVALIKGEHITRKVRIPHAILWNLLKISYTFLFYNIVNKPKGGIEEIEEKRGELSSSFSSLTRNIKLTETSM